MDKRTDPTWPTTWFVPRLTGEGAFKDVYSVMANWGANHGVTVYGHVGADLITLASMLRIPGDHAQRARRTRCTVPTAWAAFGTQDTRGRGLCRLQALRAALSVNRRGCRASFFKAKKGIKKRFQQRC